VPWNGESELTIPVRLDRAEGVGSVDLQLGYDPQVLTYSGFEKGPLAAPIDHQRSERHRVRSTLDDADRSARRRRWPCLVSLRFQALGEELQRLGRTPLVLAQLHGPAGNDYGWTAPVQALDERVALPSLLVPATPPGVLLAIGLLLAVLATLALRSAARARTGIEP
jgi:hypothetical protein